MTQNSTTTTIFNSSDATAAGAAAAAAAAAVVFDPSHVNLDVADPKQVICYLTFHDLQRAPDDDRPHDMRGARLSAIAVLFFISTASILFPLVADRVTWLRLPLYVYLTMRYFGAGIIIATAFIHLLDPAYSEIGPQTCVGMTGSWTSFSWPPAIAMTSAMTVFLLDFMIECHVQVKYGLSNINVHGDMERALTRTTTNPTTTTTTTTDDQEQQQQLQQPQQENNDIKPLFRKQSSNVSQPQGEEQKSEIPLGKETTVSDTSKSTLSSSSLELLHHAPHKAIDMGVPMTSTATSTSTITSRTFTERIAVFAILEFGVIFHSIVIGLTLGVAGTGFRTLYPVLAFHQCFEGLGIGTRMSAIPFPQAPTCWCRILPWFFCLVFGMITPVAVAIGLSFRSSYHPESFTSNAVSGVLDSISAGILLYTGFVELLARDFLFYPERSLDKYRVSFMIVCLYLGIAIMGLMGKWA